LSERYRKVVVKWKSPRGMSIALLLALASMSVSLLFVEYLSAHGLEDRVEFVRFGTASLPIRILFLPSVGIALLFIFAWVYLVQETAYVRAIPGPALEERLLSLRMVKYAAFVAAVFTSCLFMPYLLGSALFLRFLGATTTFMRFLEPYALRTVALMSSLNVINENWKYILSLNSAAFIAAVLTLLAARRGRKIALVRRR